MIKKRSKSVLIVAVFVCLGAINAHAQYYKRAVSVQAVIGDASIVSVDTSLSTNYDGTPYNIPKHNVLLKAPGVSTGGIVAYLPDYFDSGAQGSYPPFRGVPNFSVDLIILPGAKEDAFVEMQQQQTVSHLTNYHSLRVTFYVSQGKVLVQEYLNNKKKSAWEYSYKIKVGTRYTVSINPDSLNLIEGYFASPDSISNNVFVTDNFSKHGVSFDPYPTYNFYLGASGTARFTNEVLTQVCNGSLPCA